MTTKDQCLALVLLIIFERMDAFIHWPDYHSRLEHDKLVGLLDYCEEQEYISPVVWACARSVIGRAKLRKQLRARRSSVTIRRP
jgi:hypothetical protein